MVVLIRLRKIMQHAAVVSFLTCKLPTYISTSSINTTSSFSPQSLIFESRI